MSSHFKIDRYVFTMLNSPLNCIAFYVIVITVGKGRQQKPAIILYITIVKVTFTTKRSVLYLRTTVIKLASEVCYCRRTSRSSTMSSTQVKSALKIAHHFIRHQSMLSAKTLYEKKMYSLLIFAG